MSPNSFSTASVDPFVVDSGTMPAWKPPTACTGAPLACWLANVAVIDSGLPFVHAALADDVHAVTVTTSCLLTHGVAVSLQPASMVSFWPTKMPAAELT